MKTTMQRTICLALAMALLSPMSMALADKRASFGRSYLKLAKTKSNKTPVSKTPVNSSSSKSLPPSKVGSKIGRVYLPKVPVKKTYLPRVPVKKTYLPRVPVKKTYLPRVPVKLPVIPNLPGKLPVIPNLPGKLPVILEIPGNLPVFPEIPGNLPVFPEIPGNLPVFPEIPGNLPVLPEIPGNLPEFPNPGPDPGPDPGPGPNPCPDPPDCSICPGPCHHNHGPHFGLDFPRWGFMYGPNGVFIRGGRRYLPGDVVVVEQPVIVENEDVAEDADVAIQELANLPEVHVASTIALASKTPLGDKTGQVILDVNGIALPTTVRAWTSESATCTLPMIGLDKPKEARLVMMTAEGQVAHSISVLLLPAKAAEVAPME